MKTLTDILRRRYNRRASRTTMIVLLSLLGCMGILILVSYFQDEGDRYQPYGSYYYESHEFFETSAATDSYYMDTEGLGVIPVSYVGLSKIEISKLNSTVSCVRMEHFSMVDKDSKYYVGEWEFTNEEIQEGSLIYCDESGTYNALFLSDYGLVRVCSSNEISKQYLLSDFPPEDLAVYYQKQQVIIIGAWEIVRYVCMTIALILVAILLRQSTVINGSHSDSGWIYVLSPMIGYFVLAMIFHIPQTDSYGLSDEILLKLNVDGNTLSSLQRIKQAQFSDLPWIIAEGIVLVALGTATLCNSKHMNDRIEQDRIETLLEERYIVRGTIYASSDYAQLANYSRIHRAGLCLDVQEDRLLLGNNIYPYEALHAILPKDLQLLDKETGKHKLHLKYGIQLQDNLYFLCGRRGQYLAFLLDDTVIVIHELEAVPMSENQGVEAYA